MQRRVAAPLPEFSPNIASEYVSQEYLALVRSLARRIHRRLPQNVDLEDLVSAGMIGLMEASVKYDPDKNVGFASYAYRRIQGAILDSLRDLDWAPRGLRRRAREVQEAIRMLTARMRRAPSEDEVASELGLTLRAYQELLGELNSLEIGTLHRKSNDDSGEEELVYISGSQETDPLFTCLRGELEGRLVSAIERLPEMERLVITLYYREELTRSEIAEALDIDSLRVGQIRASAVLYLRAALTNESSNRSVSSRRRKSPTPILKDREKAPDLIRMPQRSSLTAA